MNDEIFINLSMISQKKTNYKVYNIRKPILNDYFYNINNYII